MKHCQPLEARDSFFAIGMNDSAIAIHGLNCSKLHINLSMLGRLPQDQSQIGLRDLHKCTMFWSIILERKNSISCDVAIGLVAEVKKNELVKVSAISCCDRILLSVFEVFLHKITHKCRLQVKERELKSPEKQWVKEAYNPHHYM